TVSSAAPASSAWTACTSASTRRPAATCGTKSPCWGLDSLAIMLLPLPSDPPREAVAGGKAGKVDLAYRKGRSGGIPSFVLRKILATAVETCILFPSHSLGDSR